MSQLPISQNRPVRLVPCFVGVHHIYYTRKRGYIQAHSQEGAAPPPHPKSAKRFTSCNKMGQGVFIRG